MSHLHGSTEHTSTGSTSSDDDPKTNGSLPPARRSVLWDFVKPTAKAALLSTATLAGTAALTAPQAAHAQIGFESATDLSQGDDGSQGAERGSSSVGDFDGDGDLDLFVTGGYYDHTARVYENEGDENGDLTDFSVALSESGSLIGVSSSSSSVGDFDGDGDLDLLVTGRKDQEYADTSSTKIYENGGDENGDLTDFSPAGAGLTDVDTGSSLVGDFDGDGDLDLVIIGKKDEAEDLTARIYENGGDENGDLTDFSVALSESGSLTGVYRGSTSVGDFDGDGDLDLLITGEDDSGNGTAQIYENGGDENGDLTDFSPAGAGLTGFGYGGSSSVGDFDGDGDLDIFITGDGDSGNETARIYENGGDENGDLTDFSVALSESGSLIGVSSSSSSVGDFDGDGDLDLLVIGYGDSFTLTTKIYENGGEENGDLTDFSPAGAGLTDVALGSSSVGDFDEDLDLDLLVTGEGESLENVATIYRNTSDVPIPVELASFTARVDGSGALLTWQTASETGNAGFEVHRMLGEGTGTFEKVGFVEGAGTTTEPQTYRFRTDQLSPGTHRFRLKQVDTDGSATYSDTIEVQVGISGAYQLAAPSPNPSEGRAQIRLTVKESQPVRVTVYDVLGREVQTVFDRTLPGQTERAIRVGEDLPTGTYMIRAVGEQFTATERLTVVE